jgi:hypothetical protein
MGWPVHTVSTPWSWLYWCGAELGRPRWPMCCSVAAWTLRAQDGPSRAYWAWCVHATASGRHPQTLDEDDFQVDVLLQPSGSNLSTTFHRMDLATQVRFRRCSDGDPERWTAQVDLTPLVQKVKRSKHAIVTMST